MNYKNLSKTTSHALRHEPEVYGLHPDPEGWVTVEAFLAALRPVSPEWANLIPLDLHEMNRLSSKQRFEIQGDRIRALYGHSTPQQIQKRPAQRPDLLYHGTDTAAAALILTEGLKCMGRQYVHLSPDIDRARSRPAQAAEPRSPDRQCRRSIREGRHLL